MITYEERGNLANDMTFRSRVKIACLTFADYITNDATSTNSKRKWAATCVQQPDATALSVSQLVVNDAKVIEAGEAITDPDLQSAVETTVNKWL